MLSKSRVHSTPPITCCVLLPRVGCDVLATSMLSRRIVFLFFFGLEYCIIHFFDLLSILATFLLYYLSE